MWSPLRMPARAFPNGCGAALHMGTDTKPAIFYDSEGRQELKKLGLGCMELEKRVGINHKRFSEWLSGKRKPSADTQILLENALGIKRELWGRVPVKAIPDPTQSPNDGYQSAASVSPQTIYDQRLADLAKVDGDIAAIETALASGNITSNNYASVMNSLRATRILRSEMLQALEDTQREWAKSTAFIDLVDRIYDALKPHTKALSAVMKIISELERTY